VESADADEHDASTRADDSLAAQEMPFNSKRRICHPITKAAHNSPYTSGLALGLKGIPSAPAS
jgi:hypothetical protein